MRSWAAARPQARRSSHPGGPRRRQARATVATDPAGGRRRGEQPRKIRVVEVDGDEVVGLDVGGVRGAASSGRCPRVDPDHVAGPASGVVDAAPPRPSMRVRSSLIAPLDGSCLTAPRSRGAPPRAPGCQREEAVNGGRAHWTASNPPRPEARRPATCPAIDGESARRRERGRLGELDADGRGQAAGFVHAWPPRRAVMPSAGPPARSERAAAPIRDASSVPRASPGGTPARRRPLREQARGRGSRRTVSNSP